MGALNTKLFSRNIVENGFSLVELAMNARIMFKIKN